MSFEVFFTQYGHYAGAFLGITLSGLGAALGQGYSFSGTGEGLSRQEESAQAVQQLQIAGLLVIESGPALGFILFMIGFLGTGNPTSFAIALTEFFLGLSFGLSALISGIAAGRAVAAGTQAASRQPIIAKKISTFMLLMESFSEVSVIFSFILGLVIRTKITAFLTLPLAIKLSAASLALSLATVGAGIAQGLLASTNIGAVGLNQHAYGKIATFTFITMAFIETPIFFAFFIAMRMVYSASIGAVNWIESLSYFGASLASGFGAAGPSIAAAVLSGKAITEIALNPNQYENIRKTTTIVLILLESGAIYSLLISLMMLINLP